MARIDRPTIQAELARIAAGLLGLLVAVVAGRAERLPIVSVPEQLRVAAVRDNVIDHLGGGDRAARLAADA